MECKKPKIIFNPYRLLPTYGESRIDLSYSNNKLDLKIYYEDKANEKSMTLSFDFVCYHKFSIFPGVDNTAIEYEEYDDLTSLIEFEQSDFKTLWEEHFNNIFKLKHFRIFFTSSNHYFEVICESFSIT